MAKQTEETNKQTESTEPESTKPSQHTPMSTTTRNVLIGVGVVVLVVVAFGAGLTAHERRGRMVTFGGGPFTSRSARGFRTGGGYGGNGPQNGNVLSGKVSAVNGYDFTLDQNGTSKTIKTDSNTRFRGVGISGLKSGDQVVVSGTTNSDGSVQALSVSVGMATTSGASSTDTPAPDTQSF